MKFKKTIFSSFEGRIAESFEFIKYSKNFIYFIIGIFFFFSFLGFFIPFPSEIQIQLLNYFRELAEKISSFNLVDLIVFIFENNSSVSFMGLFLGIFFGIFPVLSAVINGFILGFAANLSVSSEGVISLLRLFPHGIFELPAIFISLGLGVKLSTFVIKKEKAKIFKEYFEKSFYVFLLIVIPLLVLAAIIEGVCIFLRV